MFHATLAHNTATRLRLESGLAYQAGVAAMPLFRDLAPAELDLLLTRLVPRTVTAGEVIIRQGERSDRFYVVRAGAVAMKRDREVLTTLGPGEACSVIGLLLDVPRAATVTAPERTEALSHSAADLGD